MCVYIYIYKTSKESEKRNWIRFIYLFIYLLKMEMEWSVKVLWELLFVYKNTITTTVFVHQKKVYCIIVNRF